MSKLRDMPNLGDVVVKQLKAIGIQTPDELRSLGSVRAALKLSDAGFEVCSSKLAALEGAIRGVRWHTIPSEERAGLRDSFDKQRAGG